MQKINVLIAGEGKSIERFLSSKYINKLFVTSDVSIKGVLNVKFNTFRELVKKCKALQIDLVFVENEKWMLQGIGDVLRQNLINCAAPNAKWSEIGLDTNLYQKLMAKYNILSPRKITLPVDFPVVVKAKGTMKTANSIQEIVEIRKSIFDLSPEIGKTIFLEEYVEGLNSVFISLYDGKNLLTFPSVDIPQSEVQAYSSKLEFMLNSEQANFIGFINSKIIYKNNQIYNTGFNFGYVEPACDLDLLYILNSAIYQKLNEIKFN